MIMNNWAFRVHVSLWPKEKFIFRINYSRLAAVVVVMEMNNKISIFTFFQKVKFPQKHKVSAWATKWLS